MSIETFQNFTPHLGERVYIHSQAVVIGDVILGDDCSVWPFCSIRGDVNRIRIGQRTNIQDLSVLHVNHDNPDMQSGSDLIIGDDVTVGHRVILHGCHIGDRCLIGMGAIIMDDVEIGDEVIIGAGSLIARGKKVASGYLWVGNPAKPLRELTEKEREFLVYSATHYVRLKDQYLKDLGEI
ncbi:MAG: gamma carbonic anhydrase family protein [Legionellales bacterium]|nr:gamma carbonic anhydrase family protein [Legionellales bacterium]